MAIEKTIVLKADTSQATKDIKKLDDGVKGVDKSSKGAKTGLGKMSGATKMLGTAFKALGIGLIISAFMKLKDIFSGNIETARTFERVISQASAAFDVIRDRTEEFIKSLIKMKNPFKAFKEAFTGTTKEIKEEVKAMGELTDALQQVRDDERAMVVERAKANKIIAESRLLAEDETKTMQERLVALKAAVAEEQRVAQLELDIQANKVKALEDTIALGKSSEEDLIELEAEKGRLIDLQTASILKQKRVVTEINTFEKQIITEQKNREKEKLKIEEDKIKAKEKELAIEQKAADDLLALKEKEAAALLVIAEKKAADEKKIQDAEIAGRKAANIDAAKSLLSSLSQIAGEGTKAAKASALAGLLIDTATGISASIANATKSAQLAGPGAAVVTPILIAQLIGQVLGGIGSARAILSQVPGGGGSGSTPTPDIATPTGIGAGGLIPNIEAIDAVELGGTAPVQAFVVENDISNAQALQEQLEIQATL
tara:strand:- start:2547 stop:4007 length:1461 start_codon:yes stop_codon:yes gene_type:complete